MYSDRSFVYGIYQTALLQSATAAGQIWLYNFNYRGKDSYGDYFATTKDDINFKWGKVFKGDAGFDNLPTFSTQVSATVTI